MENTKIKILILEPVSDLGGVSNYILTLLSGVDQNKFKIFVGASGGGYLFKKLRELNIATPVSLPIDYNFFSFIKSVKELKDFCKKESVDIIFTNTLKAGFISAVANILLRKKMIYLAHGWRFSQKVSFPKKIFVYLIDFFVCKMADWIIVLSDYEKKFGEKYIFIKNKNITIAPIYVDTPNIKKRLNNGLNKIVGNVARATYQKNPLEFIEIAKEICSVNKSIIFVWIGGGDLLEEMKKKQKEYGLENNLILKGEMDYSLVLNEISNFNCLLFTSLFEGLPRSLIETMSIGVPIVSSNINGVYDLIKSGETGFLYKSGDTKEAAKLVLNCLNMTESQKDSMIKAQKELIAQNYSPASKLGYIYENIWNKIIQK